MPAPPSDLPYTTVTYTAADASHAFSAAGIKLLRMSHLGQMTDLSDESFIVEVTAFGDPQKGKGLRLQRLLHVRRRPLVKAPRTCAAGAKDAEHWRGNIRVIVHCTRAGAASGMWLRRAQLALGRL